jgi:hypothetical protein
MSDHGRSSKPHVTVNFVQSEFFVNRIHELEAKYDMKWQVFVAEYSTGNLPGACKNTDFVEWDFLCTNFASELLKPLEAGPPAEEQFLESQKPEANSGFFDFRVNNCWTSTNMWTRSTKFWLQASG